MTRSLLLTCLLLGAGTVQAHDPGQKGPFEVGFTNYLVIDPTRPGDLDFGVYEHRTIPVYVWYPVDSKAIGGSTPLAAYPLDVTEKRSANAINQDWPSDFLYFIHQPGSAQARAEKDPKQVKNAVQRVLQPR
jgi:hypothetical protein